MNREGLRENIKILIFSRSPFLVFVCDGVYKYYLKQKNEVNIMLYISYILSAITTVLGLIEPFGKNMRTILFLNFTGNALIAISYLLTGNMSGAAICFVACTQVLINFIFDVKEKKIPVWLVVIYIISFLSVNLLTFGVWYDIFSLAAAVILVLSVAQSAAKHYRILYFFNSTVWILYDFLAGAYGPLFTHIILFVATLLSIIIRDRKTISKKTW